MIRIAFVNLIDMVQISARILRQSRRFRKCFDDGRACGFPEHPDAFHDGSRYSRRRAEYLPGLEGIALPHIVAGTLHRADDLVRQCGPPHLPECSGQATGFRRVPAVQQQPQQVGDIAEMGQHHLRLDRIAGEEGFRHPDQRTPLARRAAIRPLPRGPLAAGIAGYFQVVDRGAKEKLDCIV